MSIITAEGTGYVRYTPEMYEVPTLHEKGANDSPLNGASPASTAAFEQGDVDRYLYIIGNDARQEIEARAEAWARFCAAEARIALAKRFNRARENSLQNKMPTDQDTGEDIYGNDRP